MFKERSEFVISGVLSKLNKKVVTGSAFTQARYKIDWKFFSDLCNITSEAYESFDTTRCKGYRILAGDGSTLNLPASKSIRKHFGMDATSKKTSLARIFLLYDVNTGFTLHARLGNMSKGESSLLADCLLKTPVKEDDLIVLDRNFGYFYHVSQMIREQRNFCIRMSTITTRFAKQVMADPRMDFTTDWTPSTPEKRRSKTKDSIKVRVTKTVLDTGETELLVSNLDESIFNTEDMAILYNMRWGVEEGIKNLKPKTKVEQFGCRKPEGIYQEYYAHILAMNMVALAGMATEKQIKKKTRKRKLAYKYNWINAFLHVRANIIELFSRESVATLLDNLITNISRSLVAIKKGRKFSRKSLTLPTRTNQYYK